MISSFLTISKYSDIYRSKPCFILVNRLVQKFTVHTLRGSLGWFVTRDKRRWAKKTDLNQRCETFWASVPIMENWWMRNVFSHGNIKRGVESTSRAWNSELIQVIVSSLYFQKGNIFVGIGHHKSGKHPCHAPAAYQNLDCAHHRCTRSECNNLPTANHHLAQKTI